MHESPCRSATSWPACWRAVTRLQSTRAIEATHPRRKSLHPHSLYYAKHIIIPSPYERGSPYSRVLTFSPRLSPPLHFSLSLYPSVWLYRLPCLVPEQFKEGISHLSVFTQVQILGPSISRCGVDYSQTLQGPFHFALLYLFLCSSSMVVGSLSFSFSVPKTEK